MVMSGYASDRLNRALDSIGSAVSDAVRGIATVLGTDAEGTTWVRLAGSDERTPLTGSTSALREGDVCSVDDSGVELVATGNYSDPAVGERYARTRIVNPAIRPVREEAREASRAAGEAEKVARAVNQHFWDDDSGAHVTDVTRDEWARAVDDGFSDLSDTRQYSNLLMNSLGLLLRSALNNLVSLTRSAIAFYDGAGNAASNIVARFGLDGVQVGKPDSAHVEVTDTSIGFADSNGDIFTELVTKSAGEYYPIAWHGYALDTGIWQDGVGNALEIDYLRRHTSDFSSWYDYFVGTYFVDYDTSFKPLRIQLREVWYAYSDYMGGPAAYPSDSDSIQEFLSNIVNALPRASLQWWVSQNRVMFRGDTDSSSAYDGPWVPSEYMDAEEGDDALALVGNIEVTGDVSTGNDVPWTNLTLSSQVTAYGSTAPQYRRWGNVVQVTGEVKPTAAISIASASDWWRICTANNGLPKGCRPSQEVRVVCHGSGTATWLMRIGTDGSITGERYQVGGTYQSIGTSTWLPFNCTFLV